MDVKAIRKEIKSLKLDKEDLKDKILLLETRLHTISLKIRRLQKAKNRLLKKEDN